MIAIIDYRAGNLTSVRLALETLGVTGVITDDPAVIRAAERVIFPGVGAAGAAMRHVKELALEAPIRDVVAAGVPFLGICVGTQILLDFSEEDGGVPCLGLLPGTVRLFHPIDQWEKVPQIGWNSVAQTQSHPLFKDIPDHSEFYFVHSYYPDPLTPQEVLGQTGYAGAQFASVLGRQNLAATQFHPEKSGRVGLKLLENFIHWNGQTTMA